MTTDASRAHRRAVLMMIAAAVCWSTGGILVRQVSITNAWEIVFWRSLAMSAFVAATLTVIHRRDALAAVVAVVQPAASACEMAAACIKRTYSTLFV
jgi:drug/metabolite transporter (DMT)-like permease